MHLLLGTLLVVAPGFLKEDNQVIHIRPISLVDAKIIDGLTQGGGDPTAVPPSTPKVETKPAEPLPPIEPKKEETQVIPPEPIPPEPEKPTAKPIEKPVEKPIEKPVEKPVIPKLPPRPNADLPKTTADAKPVTETKPVKPKLEVNLKPVRRGEAKPDPKAARLAREKAEKSRLKAEADARARRVAEFNQMATKLERNMSTGVNIGTPGPGGAAFVDYAQAVFQTYNDAWISPNDAARDNESVKVEVVIARDGRVISTRVLNRSGNAALDKSVESVLERVRRCPQFPEGTSDLQRTFTINFNLKAKRLLG